MIAPEELPMDQRHLETQMTAQIAKRLLSLCLTFDEARRPMLQS